MEGIRQMATAYYERSDEREKESVEAFYRQLDCDGDGKVTLAELKKCLPLWISNDSVYRKLDENGDGTLDFQEVLAVYYIVNKANLTHCNGCWELLSESYFSCRVCAAADGETFNLCCSCYRRNVDHQHPESCLVGNHSLMFDLRKQAINAQKTQDKREMEELRAIAKAHYIAGSPEVQELAHKFYQSMDTDGDGKVDLLEFLNFMRHKGYFHMQTSRFFTELDHDGNGTLDFFEVMTLYYIIMSGRPFCDGCKVFIPGIFFSCVNCFKTPPNTAFNLCCNCYQFGTFSHNHNHFLDNYTLLQVTRNSGITIASSERSSIQSNALVPIENYPVIPVHHTNNAYAIPYSVPYNPHAIPTFYHSPSSSMNHSYAIVHATPPPSQWEKCRIALQALEFALLMGSLTGCTIL